jgi:hypothetical protein
MFVFLFSAPRKKPINLSVVSVQATNIPPKETVVYTKQTQTTSTGTTHEIRDGKLFFIQPKHIVKTLPIFFLFIHCQTFLSINMFRFIKQSIFSLFTGYFSNLFIYKFYAQNYRFYKKTPFVFQTVIFSYKIQNNIFGVKHKLHYKFK